MSGFAALVALADRAERANASVPLLRVQGSVSGVDSSGIAVAGLSRFVRLGGLITIDADDGPLLAEVIRLDRNEIGARPFESGAKIRLGAPAAPAGQLRIWPAQSWRSRLINALGRALDGKGELETGKTPLAISRKPPEALAREPVKQSIVTGVRVVDLFTPLCLGQRVGIFAGSGVGKSTLLTMLARAQGFKTVVIALVGERGREVRDLFEAMPQEVAQKAVVVVSTGDESAMLRRLAPLTAMGLAEYFRDLGDDVLLIMDSVTRYAHACRDVAMAAGEPPVARGFPPGVFSDLPRLLERAGPGHNGTGSITGVFSVLVDGDDHNDPIADAIRGMLDGHIVLDRSIAEGGRYPAVDIPASLSRLADRAWSADQRRMVLDLRRLVSRYEDSRDLRSLGGYRAGADEELDRALIVVPRLYKLVSQRLEDSAARDVYREAAECLRVERGAIVV